MHRDARNYTIVLTTGETIDWYGDLHDVIPHNAPGMAFLVADNGTYANLRHVVLIEPAD